jgi:hypothetical protein
MRESIREVCDEIEFSRMPFCKVCVANDYYSIDDHCTCAPLAFNAGNCFYARLKSAKPNVEVAIANACLTPKLPCYDPSSDEICKSDAGAANTGGNSSNPDASPETGGVDGSAHSGGGTAGGGGTTGRDGGGTSTGGLDAAAASGSGGASTGGVKDASMDTAG